MSGTAYLDVELHLIGLDRARVLLPDREEFVGEVHLVEDLFTDLLEMEHGKDYQGYGEALFRAVFVAGGPLERGLYGALDRSRREKLRLRLRLNVEANLPPEVQGLHWELLTNGKDFEIGRSPDTLFSRYVSLAQPLSPAPSMPRLLCVVAAPVDAHRHSMAPIDYDLTVRSLKKVFEPLEGKLQVDFLERPVTPARLRDTLQRGRYQLLHVHGHGMLLKGGESALVLENAEHKVQFVQESALRGVLLGLRELKLVTLVACHGGEPSGEDQLSGLAGNLVRQGIPAVIAMRRAISMEVGIHFTRTLYAQLAEEPCIDAAVNEARHRLFMERPDRVDWSSPVLYMRLVDGLLWQERPQLPPEVPDAKPPTIPEPKRPGNRLLLILVLLAFGISAVLFNPFSKKDEPSDETTTESTTSDKTVPPVVEPEPRRQPSTSTSVPPPPPREPAVPMEAIQAGKVGIGAISSSSAKWQNSVASIVSRQLRQLRPELKPVTIPSELRSKLGQFQEGELSTLPGGDRAPYGMEYLLLVVESHGPHQGAMASFPTVSVRCELVLIATRGPSVHASDAFSHLGQDVTEDGALEQAFGRCLEDFVTQIP